MRWFKRKNSELRRQKGDSALFRPLKNQKRALSPFMVHVPRPTLNVLRFSSHLLFVMLILSTGALIMPTGLAQSESVTLIQGDWTTAKPDSSTTLPLAGWHHKRTCAEYQHYKETVR